MRLLIQETLGLRQRRDVNTRKRPLPGKLPNLLTELQNLFSTLLALFDVGGNTNEVFEELATGLLLENEGKLNGTVEEVGDDLHVVLEHVTGSESGSSETDTTRNLGRGVTRNRVFYN